MANSGVGSKADAAVKLVLISFVVLLSFSVGTFVGKQVSDANHRRADLEIDYSGSTSRTVASEPEAVGPISDAEIAALREEFEKTEAQPADGYRKLSSEKPVKAAAPAAEATGAAKEPAPVSQPAQRVAQALAPAPEAKKEVRTPNAALPSVATSAIGKYTVQVASYASESEAREQVAKLKDKGYGAFYVPADIKGQTWFRVSVGLFADQNSAMNYRKEILDSRAVSSAIVQKIVQ
jgi:cell division septation protein DedD